MPVVKTPRAIIEVLDSDGKITGYEIENIYTFSSNGTPEEDEMVKLFNAGPRRDEATEDEVAALRKQSAEGLTAGIKDAHDQIADLQTAAQAATAEAQTQIAEAQNAQKFAEDFAAKAQAKVDNLKKLVADLAAALA